MPNEPTHPPATPRSKARCPICGKPVLAAFRPFCSDRCRQVDLGRWLNGAYVIPGPPPLPEDEDEVERSRNNPI